MRISTLAKQYIKQILAENALFELMGKDVTMMSKDDFIRHQGGLHMATSSMMACIKRKSPDGPPRYEDMCAEVDRRAALIGDNWVPKNGRFIKTFNTPSDMMDALRIMKECGLPIETSGPPTDDTTELFLSAKTHRVLSLLMEGRITELE